MIPRVLDLAILLLLAVAVLLPRPDVKVKPALTLPEDQRDRVAELQTRLLAAPGDLPLSLELADIFIDARRPDWALATLADALDAHPQDHRLHFRRSLAMADHFEAAPAFYAVERALALCQTGSTAPCGESERARLELLRGTLERIRHIDMRKNPNAAKVEILQALRPATLARPRPKKPDAGAR